VAWIGDFLMGLLVCAVFALAPLMMRYTWETTPLPAGDLRLRLEAIARQLKLRYRDILVWHSRGMLVNAAVMGILPSLRYVLLSDGLLDSMSTRQIEAVFGHEAGHVRCRHIPYFILFATLTMLVGGGILLLVEPHLSTQYSQILVGLVIVLLWGLAFGWLSHQFEYQADLAGAASITPSGDACSPACLLHSAGPAGDAELCTTAAREFSVALLRVAALNGIPGDEHGWRHPSIQQRVAFLERVSLDPAASTGFLRRLQIAKAILILGTAVGLALATYLYWDWLWPGSRSVG
jgi:STE24 endopeptidase